MFSKLNTIIIDLFELIQNIIETRTVQSEILGRNNTASSIVNKVFFLVFGSILRIITLNENIYISLKVNQGKISKLMHNTK